MSFMMLFSGQCSYIQGDPKKLLTEWCWSHGAQAQSSVVGKLFFGRFLLRTRQSKQCGFIIYILDNSESKSMVRSEKMALSGLVFARKIARMILIQNI